MCVLNALPACACTNLYGLKNEFMMIKLNTFRNSETNLENRDVRAASCRRLMCMAVTKKKAYVIHEAETRLDLD